MRNFKRINELMDNLIMIKTIRAHYTGSVFEPIDKIDLKDGTDVILSIILNEPEKSEDLWSVLDMYSGTIEGISNTDHRSSDFSGSLIIIERITSVPSLRSILSMGSKTEPV